MAAMATAIGFSLPGSLYFIPKSEKWSIYRSVSINSHYATFSTNYCRTRETQLSMNSNFSLRCSIDSSYPPMSYEGSKKVWIWTKSKEVMTAAIERGWNTFLFSPEHLKFAKEWSSIALIEPLYIEAPDVFNEERKRVATISVVSTPQELQDLSLKSAETEDIIIDLLDWQVVGVEVRTLHPLDRCIAAVLYHHMNSLIFDYEIIPAENIIAAFHGSQKTVFAISKSQSEAQIFLEALQHGLGGVVLKVDDVDAVLKLKNYFDRRNEERNVISLTKATITRIEVASMGDRVCVDLCSVMRTGEGLLVGSFARGLFLVHSECLESNYIASRPFRVNAGPVHAYVATPGGKTCYLSELKAGKEVIVVDQKGHQRTAIVGRVKIETRPLILVEAKENSDDETIYGIFLQNAETVALISPSVEDKLLQIAIPVTSLKVGDQILLRVQGGARHTGIEIEEFIIEN